ncbi:MAG: MATE family efflux transporter, partial [Oscillospiraceae bacterium]
RAAIAMGNKDNNTAEKILGNSITMLLGLSVILFTAFYFSKDFILMAFGASAQSLPYASDYLTIYLYGTPFVMLTFGLNIFITNQGFTKISMITVIIGCVLNIILDPIFIFALNMGVKGAALATIISQGVSAFFVIGFLLSKKSTLKVRLKNLKLSKVLVGSILSLGVSPFLMQSTECLIQLIFNTGMQKYGNDNYVALMSIFFSVTQILLMPMQGLTQGVSPIISYNYGAKNMARVRETFNLLFTVCIGLSAISVVFAEIFPGVLIGLFTSDASLIALGIKPLRIFVFGMAIFGAQSACQQTFLALGQAKVSMFLAALRKIILLTPLALLLPLIPKLGIWGLFIAEPVSDILATTTTIIMFIFMSKKLGFRKEKIK